MITSPHSVSWADELDAIVERRRNEERMTRSEYVRKCIREEAEREHARRVQAVIQTLPHHLAA